MLPRSLEAAEKNDITGLQKLSASYVPIFRHNEIANDHGVLAEDLFAGGTNNMTTTQYRVRKSRRLVFTVQRVHKMHLAWQEGNPALASVTPSVACPPPHPRLSGDTLRS